jgi:hypothetical protein
MYLLPLWQTFCDVWLTFIHMDAHAFALVLIAILLEPLSL